MASKTLDCRRGCSTHSGDCAALGVECTALLRCRVVGKVGLCGVLSSDGEDEFGEGVRDPMPRIDVGG